MKATVEFPNPALKSILKQRGFKISWNKVKKSGPSAFGRRHFYLILLSIGNSKIHYDDRVIHLDGVYLFFANSRIPYATEILSEKHTGYSCVFTEEFIKPLERLENFQKSPLFQLNSNPAFKLNPEQQSKLTEFFDTMIARDSSEYLYKDDLMRTYIELIIHEALQMRPAEHFIQSKNASLRIVTQFMDILERQFPIENLSEPLKLKTAQDYATLLSIHVNYLNRAVREITGKSTTAILAERITAEAITLLRHTDWSISDIAYTLGFEYANYFSNFFKKTTGNIPKFYRDH
ncbi:AraC family transcriptional regulator [Flavobacterium sp. ZE23DGlu08]|jgi:AraC-like DNA-binding protein|uniref:helix-turn-helix domain-containing protein n=1 Tax=Flavobacterium sp. ZE23DGlu08 TaxID=3059026 RepID=UPI00265E98A5|nr:AraC family transcriptional regulator [Flavobacterium sp. ZE23DGlu08]WKL44471.1 AraC family transcriptional regulator [Flavobacterium sp. ZE23DGlu08]